METKSKKILNLFKLLESSISDISISDIDKQRDSISFFEKLKTITPGYTLKLSNSKVSSSILNSTGGFLINSIKLEEGSYRQKKDDSEFLVVPSKRLNWKNEEEVIETRYLISNENEIPVLEIFRNINTILMLTNWRSAIDKGFKKAKSQLNKIRKLPSEKPEAPPVAPASASILTHLASHDPEMSRYAEYLDMDRGSTLYKIDKFMRDNPRSNIALMTFTIYFSLNNILSNYVKDNYRYGTDYVVWTGKLGNTSQIKDSKGNKRDFIRSEYDDDAWFHEMSIVFIKKDLLQAALTRLGLTAFYKTKVSGEEVVAITDVPDDYLPDERIVQTTLGDSTYDKLPKANRKSYEDPEQFAIPGDIAHQYGKLLFDNDIKPNYKPLVSKNSINKVYRELVSSLNYLSNKWLSDNKMIDYLAKSQQSVNKSRINRWDLTTYLNITNLKQTSIFNTWHEMSNLPILFWTFIELASASESLNFRSEGIIDASYLSGIVRDVRNNISHESKLRTNGTYYNIDLDNKLTKVARLLLSNGNTK